MKTPEQWLEILGQTYCVLDDDGKTNTDRKAILASIIGHAQLEAVRAMQAAMLAKVKPHDAMDCASPCVTYYKTLENVRPEEVLGHCE